MRMLVFLRFFGEFSSEQGLSIHRNQEATIMKISLELVLYISSDGCCTRFDICYFPLYLFQTINPAGNFMFKVNTRNTRKKCEICSKLTTKTPEQLQRCRSGAFIVNFEHISPHVSVFLLLTLSR